jgi:hypothetical protein
MSNIAAREAWRAHSIISPAVKAHRPGLGPVSYLAALRALVDTLRRSGLTGDRKLMNQWIDRCCRGIEAVIAAMLAVMVVLVFGNVVLRYGFNSGIHGVRRGVALALHLDDLPRRGRRAEGARPPGRRHGGAEAAACFGKKVCLLVGHVVMLYIVWLLFQGSVAQTRINWDVTAPVTGASMAVVYAVGRGVLGIGRVDPALDLYRMLTGPSPTTSW